MEVEVGSIQAGVVPSHDMLHYIVPDGSGAGDTNNIPFKELSIGIPGPDANHHIGRIPDCPVILEIIRCTRLSRDLVNLPINGLPVPHGENMIVLKLKRTRLLIIENRSHQEGKLGANDREGRWVCCIVMVDVVSIIIPDIQNADGRDTSALVGEDLVGSNHLDQGNASRAEG